MLTVFKGESTLLAVTVLDLEQRPKTDIATVTAEVFSISATNAKVPYLAPTAMEIQADGLCTLRWTAPATPIYDEAVASYVIIDSEGYSSAAQEQIKFLEPVIVTGTASGLTPTEHEWLRVAFDRTQYLQYDPHAHVKSAEQHPVFTDADRIKMDEMHTDIKYLKDLEGGRWKIDKATGVMTFYGQDNITVIARFQLKDRFGNPVLDAGQSFERVKI